MRASRLVLIVVLLLVGGVWLGQGVGLIPGSFMTGSSTWAVIGAALVGLAIILAWTERRANARR